MKRAFLCTLAFLLAATVLAGSAVRAVPVETFTTHAAGASLIDVKSGRILYSKKGEVPMRIASLTKIMTAIVAIEQSELNEKVTVGSNAYAKEGSSIYLKLGEVISLKDLLYGLMLRSGNDAATAIAEHVGGSIEGFVYLMNGKAEELGMDHSHFMNPSGLDAEGHYASSDDMARLTAYALRNSTFAQIVKTPMVKVPRQDQPWDSLWTNKNKMLALYPGADGVKTGYTKLSRRCLVSSASRGDQQLAAITLNDSDDWADHARMLDYGFRTYPLQKVVAQGEKVRGDYEAGTTFFYPATKEEAPNLRKEFVGEDARSVDYRLGERGALQVYLGNQQIGSVPVYVPGSPASRAFDNKHESKGSTNNTAEKRIYEYFHRLKTVLEQLVTVPLDGKEDRPDVFTIGR